MSTASLLRWSNRLFKYRNEVIPLIPVSPVLSDSHLVLYDTLLALFVDNWLGICEFVVVDTALCNTYYRKHFRRLLKRKHILFSFTATYSCEGCVNHAFLKWFADRRVGFDSLVIDHVFDFIATKHFKHFRKTVYSRVQNLKIRKNDIHWCDMKGLKCFHKSLKSLTMSFEKDLKNLKYLKKFSVLTELILPDEDYISNKVILEIARTCPQLTSLGFVYSCDLNEECFVTVCKTLKQLVKLEINCRTITGVALYTVFSEYNASYQKVSLMVCLKVTDELLVKIAATSANSLTHFEHIPPVVFCETVGYGYCSQTTPEGIKAFLNACVNLTHLDLKYQSHAVFHGHTDYVKNANLKHLCLSGCEALDDDACRSISYAYCSIDYLDLSECYSLSGVGILTLATTLHKLTCLNLNCEEDTGDYMNVEIGTLVKANPLLRTLQLLHRVSNLDAINSALVASRISLTEVVLSHCCELVDNDLVALSNASSELTSLNLVGCVLLTDATLESLSENCQKLKVLRVNGCTGFSLAGTAMCMVSCKMLRQLIHYQVQY